MTFINSPERQKYLKESFLSIQNHMNSVIIGITLITLFIIPLIFNYANNLSVFTELKRVTLHLGAGLISILWLSQIIGENSLTEKTSTITTIRNLLPNSIKGPSQWAITGLALWLTALIISTIISPLPDISFFGAEDNRSGYNLYDKICLFVIALSIATKFRSESSLKLLIYALIATGTITSTYGIAQHFGWDPIFGNIGLSRIQASFGNPIDFGAYMVMTIPASLTLSYFGKERPYPWMVLTIALISLQLAGLWLTGSRGPYIASASSIILFFFIALSVSRIRTIIRPALALFAGLVIAAMIVSVPTDRNKDNVILERVVNLKSQFQDLDKNSNEISGGLAGRINIWRPTFELATQWDVPSHESNRNKMMRPVFGLGPDMFVYSFPLVAKPRTGIAVVDHAHNYELQILMEQGWLGLIGFLMFISSLIMMAIVIVQRLRHTAHPQSIMPILALALLPPMIGKIIEIQTGVPRVSDLAMMFALFGATIALYRGLNPKTLAYNQHQINLAESRQDGITTQRYNKIVLISKGLMIVVATSLVITVFITWDLRRLSASQSHASASSNISQFDQIQGWAEAQSKSPERSSFTNGLFSEYFHGAIYLHDNEDHEEALQLMVAARELLLKFEKHDPFKRDTQLNLLHTEVALFQWGYKEYAQQAVDRSQRIAKLYPSYPLFFSIMATDMVLIGMNELAINYADRAIDVEDVTQPWSKAWYAKGRALYQLGQTEQAITILTTATKKQPGAEGAIFAHKLLAKIYQQEGPLKNSDLSEFHKQKGDETVTTVE